MIVDILCSAIKDAVVVKADVTEEVSHLFDAEVYLKTDVQIDTEKLLNTVATLAVKIDDQNTRYFSGIIEHAKFENIVSPGDINNGNLLYIRIVPTFTRTKYATKYRSFQEKTAIDIIHSILKENNISNVEFKLHKTERAKRSFCVQYGESDFHFLSRLMEEEGLFYYFEHEKAKDTLQISDISSAGRKIITELKIRQYATNVTMTPNSVYNVSFSDTLGTKKVDAYSYSEQKAEVIYGNYTDNRDKGNLREQEIYSPTFKQKSDGNDITKIILESENSLTKQLTGNSYCPELYPGAIFKISGSRTEKHNGEFFTVSVKHCINQMPDKTDTPIYYNSFVGIPSNIPFRPILSHFKNRIYGCQTALVTGTSGEAIFCDSDARIKVKFHWDSRTQPDENSSCWIRTAQTWAGNNFGSLIIPRVGMEVLVQFVNGDPDQPIVVGCLYNGINKAIEYAKDNNTVSSFRTHTSQGGDGFNELSFNDKKADEEIFIHAQKDMNLIIENSVQEVLNEGSQKITLEAQKEPVEHSLTIKCGKNSIILNEGDYVVLLDKGNQTITLKEGDQSVTLSKGNLNIDVTGDISIKATKNINIETQGELNIKSTKRTAITSGDVLDVKSNKETKIECQKLLANAQNAMELITLSFKCEAKSGITMDGLSIKVNAKATLDLSSTAATTVKANAMLQLQGTAGVAVQGAMIKLN